MESPRMSTLPLADPSRRAASASSSSNSSQDWKPLSSSDSPEPSDQTKLFILTKKWMMEHSLSDADLAVTAAKSWNSGDYLQREPTTKFLRPSPSSVPAAHLLFLSTSILILKYILFAIRTGKHQMFDFVRVDNVEHSLPLTPRPSFPSTLFPIFFLLIWFPQYNKHI